jgi:tRNA G18 (ribose-2'-O)-methylase SpoU
MFQDLMAVFPLTDDLDPELRPYLGLYGSRTAEHPKVGACFICEGRFLVEEALAAHREGKLQVLSILATPSILRDLQVPTDVPTLGREKPVLEKILGFSFHRGLLCCAAIPAPPLREQLLMARRLVVLPRLDNVDNLGQILRTAAALGIDAVLAGQGPGPFDRRTVRVSMGASWKIPIFQEEELGQVLMKWREHMPGTPSEIIGATLQNDALNAAQWQPRERTALLLGPEDQGLDSRWLDLCDQQVRIPMARRVDSLNVAAAGAILMFRMCEAT